MSREIDELEVGLCWGSLQKASLPELMDTAGRHGFPTLSVRPGDFDAALKSGLSEAQLRRRLADAGVRARVIDAIGGALPGQPAASATDNEEACYRTAEALGAPIVNLNHYRGGPVTRAELVDAIGGICRRAAGRGLQIVLEFVPDTGLGSLVEAFAVVQGVGERNCTILLDPWHLARSGGTLEEVQGLPPGALGALQLCDRTAPPPGTAYVPMSGRDLPGEGELPLCEIVRAALANNPDLTAEVEVFSDELRGLSIDAAAARIATSVKAWRASC